MEQENSLTYVKNLAATAYIMGVDESTVDLSQGASCEPVVTNRRQLATTDPIYAISLNAVVSAATASEDCIERSNSIASNILARAPNVQAEVSVGGICGDGVCNIDEKCLDGNVSGCCPADCPVIEDCSAPAFSNEQCGGVIHGICENGSCSCNEAYTGDTCSECSPGFVLNEKTFTCVRLTIGRLVLETCDNGILDNGETSIDCGGPKCPSCDSSSGSSSSGNSSSAASDGGNDDLVKYGLIFLIVLAIIASVLMIVYLILPQEYKEDRKKKSSPNGTASSNQNPLNTEMDIYALAVAKAFENENDERPEGSNDKKDNNVLDVEDNKTKPVNPEETDIVIAIEDEDEDDYDDDVVSIDTHLNDLQKPQKTPKKVSSSYILSKKINKRSHSVNALNVEAEESKYDNENYGRGKHNRFMSMAQMKVSRNSIGSSSIGSSSIESGSFTKKNKYETEKERRKRKRKERRMIRRGRSRGNLKPYKKKKSKNDDDNDEDSSSENDSHSDNSSSDFDDILYEETVGDVDDELASLSSIDDVSTSEDEDDGDSFSGEGIPIDESDIAVLNKHKRKSITMKKHRSSITNSTTNKSHRSSHNLPTYKSPRKSSMHTMSTSTHSGSKHLSNRRIASAQVLVASPTVSKTKSLRMPPLEKREDQDRVKALIERVKSRRGGESFRK
eukprot:TRINITY_DN9072_c0_g1_i1.p1 TRINITY_DN9072_c0_g1~~TRINITY_DN9072_c0_g1_i1.p1  ORF type:complete len:674 (+),score=227.58 TRINITY_DN9072_c0_g1_i1:783-2804(+)